MRSVNTETLRKTPGMTPPMLEVNELDWSLCQELHATCSYPHPTLDFCQPADVKCKSDWQHFPFCKHSQQTEIGRGKRKKRQRTHRRTSKPKGCLGLSVVGSGRSWDQTGRGKPEDEWWKWPRPTLVSNPHLWRPPAMSPRLEVCDAVREPPIRFYPQIETANGDQGIIQIDLALLFNLFIT